MPSHCATWWPGTFCFPRVPAHSRQFHITATTGAIISARSRSLPHHRCLSQPCSLTLLPPVTETDGLAAQSIFMHTAPGPLLRLRRSTPSIAHFSNDSPSFTFSVDYSWAPWARFACAAAMLGLKLCNTLHVWLSRFSSDDSLSAVPCNASPVGLRQRARQGVPSTAHSEPARAHSRGLLEGLQALTSCRFKTQVQVTTTGLRHAETASASCQRRLRSAPPSPLAHPR